MLKITKVEENGTKVLMKLEGKVMGQWAALLDDECRSFIRQKKVVYLECSNVDFVDDKGIEVLNNLSRTQVTLMSAPGFVTELLQIGGRS